MRLSRNFIEGAKAAGQGAIIGLGIVGYAATYYQVNQIMHPKPAAQASISRQAPAPAAPVLPDPKLANSKKGTAYMLDYEILNAKDKMEAADTIDSLGMLPLHYRKILHLQGTKVIIAASDKDLPEDLKKRHDINLAAYKKETGIDRLCGIAISNKTTAAMNTTSITFLHCGSAPFYNLHELAHAFDVSAAYLLIPGGTELSRMPAFYGLYCKKMTSLNPNADCNKKMPNGTPEFKEIFADAFARYYSSEKTNSELSKTDPEIYYYFGRLEKSTLEKLAEIKQ